MIPARACPVAGLPRVVACAVFIATAGGCGPQPSLRTTTVDFEVTEGTNLAFDISPDGETIVFDLLGQLWLMPAEGGEARPLTDAVRDTADDVDPTFSPDGQWIVFQTDRPGESSLWLISASGSEARRVTPGHVRLGGHVTPSWSPDGVEIAYAGRDTLYRLQVGSRTISPLSIELPEGTWGPRGTPSWSPSGTTIAFGTGAGGPFRFNLRTNARIWEVPADGGAALPVTPEGVRAVSPSYAPDGVRIAYFAPDSVGKWQVWVQPGAGARASRLTSHDDMAYRRVRWSPDGSALLYAADGKIWTIAAEGGTPEEIPFTARVRFERQRPTLAPVRFPAPGSEQRARGFRALALSPDGSRIAMLALGRLWVWPIDGSPRAVTDVAPGASAVSWSGDGSEVVIASGDLYAVTLGAGETRRLTALTGTSASPAWSPDGRHIAFIHRPADCPGACPYRIRVIDAQGETATDLSATLDLAPAEEDFASWPQVLWRADSKSLLTYVHGFDETTGRAISLDGGSATLERFPTGATYLASPRPDTVVYVQGNRLWGAVVDTKSGLVGEPWPLSDEPALYMSAAARGAILYVSEDGLRLRAVDGSVTRLGWPVRYEVPPAPRPLLIRAARLIDGSGGVPTDSVDLLLQGGRIARIEATNEPHGLTSVDTIDVGGRTVIPGLMDLHRHLLPDYHGGVPQSAGALYHGTTTVRDVGSALADAAALRDMVQSGRWPGPRVVFSGFIFHGQAFLGGLGNGINQYVADPDQIARGAAIARAFGSDYVKHRGFRRWGIAATTVGAAHRHGMRISGHCGSVLPVVAAGIDGQEHAGSCYRDARGIYEDYARLKAETGSWVVTTTGVFLNFLQSYADPAYFERPDIAPFLGGIARASYRPELFEQVRPLYERLYRWDRVQTARYHESGVAIATGTDNYLPTAVHAELEALVASGLTPLEAITAATSAAARALGADAELGTVEVGKLADLVILDADPLADIRNTRRIWRVIQGGRVVDRAALLERVRALGMTLQHTGN